MKTTIFSAILFVALVATPAICAEQQFKDVPKNHWAAEYVAAVADKGIMKGYPDTTFKGDKAVTRYELAVALERMIEVVEKGLKPEVEKHQQVAPTTAPASSGEGTKTPAPKPESKNPAQDLKARGYIAADSPLLTSPSKTVTPTELAQALSSVAKKLIDKTIPPPKDME